MTQNPIHIPLGGSTRDVAWIDEYRLPRWLFSRLPTWDVRVQYGLIAGALTVITLATYIAGGTHTSVPQAQYIAIILGAFWFGMRGGVLTGLLAGLAMGPFMPLNVDANESQQTVNWLLRIGIFVFVGGFTGWLAASMRSGMDEISELGAQAIHSFVRMIDVKSTYTAEHSEKVADYAAEIAVALELPLEETERIYWAALIHDIGKVRISRSILDKPARLDVRELSLMRMHPIHSVEILKGIKQFESLLPAIRSHHERWDGTGYPDGLRGEDIPFEARILCVADAFDAMTSNRPYRPAMSEQQALEELRANAGTQFDPEIVEAFIRSRTKGSAHSLVA